MSMRNNVSRLLDNNDSTKMFENATGIIVVQHYIHNWNYIYTAYIRINNNGTLNAV